MKPLQINTLAIFIKVAKNPNKMTFFKNIPPGFSDRSYFTLDLEITCFKVIIKEANKSFKKSCSLSVQSQLMYCFAGAISSPQGGF